MTGNRRAGPVGTDQNSPDIDAETLVRGPSPSPRPVGAESRKDIESHDAPVDVTEHRPGSKTVIYFGQNRKEPLPLEIDKLKPLEKVLERRGTRVTIVGHASKEGSDEYNMKLSEERAKFIRDYLLVMGGELEQIKVKGRGEREPAVPERGRGAELEVRRTKNRRVEVAFVAGDLHQHYVDRVRGRYKRRIDILRRRLKKAEDGLARTLGHPDKHPMVLRHWQEEVDAARSELEDYERWLKELESAEKSLRDPGAVWRKISRAGNYYDEMIRLHRDLIKRSEKRFWEAKSKLSQTTNPKERGFWQELVNSYQDALKDYRKELEWLSKDKARASRGTE